jgi:hypothetical protein
MPRLGRATLAIALLGAAAPARGAAPSFEITPLAGYRVGGAFHDTSIDANRDILEHSSFGLALDLARTPDTQWELTYSREDTRIEGATGAPASEPLDLRIEYLQLGGTYFWSETERKGVEPYVVGGLGITRFSPARAGLDDRIEPSINVGVGLRVPLSKRIALRIEGRGYVTLLETDGSVFCRSNGGDAACTIHARARGLWQIEGLIGLAFRL